MVSKVFHRCKPLKINGNVHSFIHKPRWICDLKSLHATSKSWRHRNHGNRYRSMKIWGSLSIYTPVHSTIFPKSTNLPNLPKNSTTLGVFRAKPRYLKKGHSKIISTSGLLHLLTLKDRHQMPGCQFRDTKQSWPWRVLFQNFG